MSNFFYLHCCTTFKPINIIFTLNMYKTSESAFSKHQADWFQSQQFSELCFVFFPSSRVDLIMLITACTELWKVVFAAPSVCVFCLCMSCWMDLHQIHTEDVFGPSLRRVSRSPETKKRNFSAASVTCMQFMFGKLSLASSSSHQLYLIHHFHWPLHIRQLLTHNISTAFQF